MPPPVRIRDIDPLIYNFQVEQRLSRSEVAMQTLKRVASLVKPIMRAHNFKIGTLAEFYPKEKGLLGLNSNAGESIHLRLRYPADSSQFESFEMVMDTMLHELTHNTFGPHDANFHAMWDQLRDEYTALTMRGFTGEAFLSKGQRVGGKRIPRSEVQRIARNVGGERRKKLAAVNQKLGGARPRPGFDLRSAIAGAAFGRLQIDQGCASQRPKKEQKALVDEASFNGFKTKADEDDANEVAIQQALWELAREDRENESGYQPPEGRSPITGSGETSTSSRKPLTPFASRPSTSTPSLSQPAIARSYDASPWSSENNIQGPVIIDDDPPLKKAPPEYIQLVDDSWECAICTLLNKEDHLCCDACGIERPGSSPPRAAGKSASRGGPATRPSTAAIRPPQKQAVKSIPKTWTCGKCSKVMESEWWTCSVCGTMKTSS